MMTLIAASMILFARADDFDAPQIECGDESSDQDRGNGIWQLGSVAAMNCRSDPNSTEQGLQDVVQQHGPSDEKSHMRADRLAYVSVCRTRRRIDACHAAIAEGCDHHRQHGDQNGRDGVSVGEFLRNAKQRNRSRGLDQDQTIKDQVPKRQDSSQARCSAGLREDINSHGSHV